MGTGIGHYIPLVAYLGFWVAIFVSLFRNPAFGIYYMLPFLPYRTMRDHFIDWPLGGNVLTILVVAVLLGALAHGKKLPRKTPLIWIWLGYGVYMYFSMWMGSAMTSAPAPLWTSDANFATWKDYMLLPLILTAASMVLEDRKAIRTVCWITAFSVLMIDRSSLMDSLSHSWVTFDEDKRSPGPLAIGSNETAAFLAQFSLYLWGFLQFVKRKKYKLWGYIVVALTLLACMYSFSRAAYMAVVASVIVLGLLKDRKLVVIAAVFLFTWQVILPTAVTQRVNMTHDANGKLEASAEERVQLWTNAEQTMEHYPILGLGYATFQYGEHFANLRDTHNWYVKVMVETGLVGMCFALALLYNMFKLSIRLYRRATDPLFKGLGLGLILCMVSLVITNCFGDRWTYIEINGILWVLMGAAMRADQLTADEKTQEPKIETPTPTAPPSHRYVYAS